MAGSGLPVIHTLFNLNLENGNSNLAGTKLPGTGMLLIIANAVKKNLQWMELETYGVLMKLKMILITMLFLINLFAE